MNQRILVLFAILLAVQAIHMQQLYEEKEAGIDLPPGTVNLIADNGEFLRVCRNCGANNNRDSASVQANPGDGTAVWTL